jgi:hypothetical protein
VVNVSEEREVFGRDYFSRLFRGIIKLLLAGFIVGAVSAIAIPDLNVGGSSISGSLIKSLLQFIIPIALILSALEDFGVKL